MTSLEGRLRTVERRLGALGHHPLDAMLKAAIVRDTFTPWHIDRLFEQIHEPFRAAIVAAAASFAGKGGFYDSTRTILGDFAMHIVVPDIVFADWADERSILARCEQVLNVPETTRDPQYIPEYYIMRRVQRGLAQRLVARNGLEELRESVGFYSTHQDDEWPLPVMTPAEIKRLVDLVSPIEKEGEYPALLWRNEDGTPRWTYQKKQR